MCGIIIGAIIALVVFAMALEACLPSEEESQRPAEHCFSPIDGNLSGLEDRVRPLLASPRSMRTHSTSWVDVPTTEGYHAVRMIYSAENAFGARIQATARGRVHGETCRVILDDPGF